MNADDLATMRQCARTYVRLTGRKLTLRGVCSPYERDCAEFIKAGFTNDDLTVVIKHIQQGIRDGKRHPGALRWHYLIRDLACFDEELSMARAALRVKKPTALDRVLAIRDPKLSETVSHTAQPANEVLNRQAFVKFQQWRKESGL
jgi:hypothetical protein